MKHAWVLIGAIGVAALCGCARTTTCMRKENMLINTSMEHWHETGVTPQAWGAWTSPENWGRFRVHRDGETVRDGKASMKIVADRFVNVFSGAAVGPGREYTLSAWVRAEKATRMLTKFSVGGKSVKKGEREKIQRTWELPSGEWVRVHITGVMPAGADRVTTYFCFQGDNVYHFDRAMMNEGPLADYLPGRNYRPIAPLGRTPQPGDVQFTPRSYDKDDTVIDDPWARFAFDSDIMSFAKRMLPSQHLPKRVGVEFSGPVLLRGLSLLLDKPGIPEGVRVGVGVLNGGTWSTLAHREIPVGCVTLLAIEPATVDGIRIELTAKDGKKTPCPKIAHIGLVQ